MFKFKHYIFTRFNLLGPASDNHIYKRPDAEEWMRHRMELFENHTLPSVMIQTCMNFTWLLAFAFETPKWITDKYAEYPNVKIIHDYPRTWIRHEYVGPDLGRIKKGDWIITSRLDNDDIILPEYIESIQSCFDLAKSNDKPLLVDVNGYQYDLATGKHYDPDRAGCTSPFISLIEQVGTPWQSISNIPGEGRLITEPVKTVYYCSHSKMEWHFPSVKIPKRLYKMVIHDRNVSNHITGYEIKP